jgi:hypothetical protein
VFERDLSAFSESLLCRFVVALSSLHCVCCCCIVLLCVYSTPSTTSILIVFSCVRRDRFQLVEIPHNRDIVRYKEESVLRFDLWIT